MTRPTDAEIAELDGKARRSLDGDDARLDVLGYGEISTVLRLDAAAGSFACKRLPPFPDREAFDRYVEVLGDYLARLEGNGVDPIPTEVRVVSAAPVIGYCVQPLVPEERLATRVLAGADAVAGRALLREIAVAVTTVIRPDLGLDAQLSNWVVEPDGSLRYLDVTTPMLRDDAGRERLDTDVFLASLPWALRGGVRRFLLGEILGHYYSARSALVDFVANLHKEGLEQWVAPACEELAEHLDPPITPREARRYYRSDALMWGALQRLRRADRAWQRRVRRRRYPFLLPGRIDRRR